MNKIKVLQVVPTLSQANGVAAYISNYFSKMNKKKFDVTFAVLYERDHGRYAEIEANGGKIVELFVEKNIIKYLKKVKEFFKKNQFDIIHCNVANTGAIFLYYAKKFNVKVRILHSHATQSSDKFLNKIRNDIILLFTKQYANHYFSCSPEAGKAMFKNKKYTIINNAIDYEKYKYLEENNIKKRLEMNISLNDQILGFVGRFAIQKNVFFFIELAKELKDNQKILMIGSGNLKEAFMAKVEENNLQSKFIILDNCSDVYNYYSIMNVFLLPSLYEGLPVVGIEAQANGLPCLLSDTISKDCKILETTKFLNKDNLQEWVYNINNSSLERQQNNELDDKYDINVQVTKYEGILEKLLKESK